MADDLTPVERRRLKSSRRIEETPAERIAYQHTVLCQIGLPYRNPGDDVRTWRREQGLASLRLEAGAVRDPSSRAFIELGLPYGSRPRLILVHLHREALLRQSPEIEVETSLTAFIRRMQRGDPNGKEVRRFKDQMMRLSAALVRLAYDASDDHAYQVDMKIITALDLWSQTHEGQRVLWPSVVRLSQDYFESLSRHAVPLDERAIAALANSALALDLYAWLAQRLRRVSPGRPQRITWPALHEQFGDSYQHIRQFRAVFLKVLALVHSQYRTARVEADEVGLTLRNSPPPVSSRLVPVRKSLT